MDLYFYRMNKKFRKLSLYTLVLILFITLVGSYFLKNTRFNYDFESFFPVNDPSLQYYLSYRDKFESDNDFLFITIINKQGIFTSNFLKKLQNATHEISNIKNIIQVQSPTNISWVVFSPLGPIEIPYLHVLQDSLYAQDSARIYQDPKLIGTFFSKDAKAVSLLIKHTEFLSKNKSDSLLNIMEKTVEKYAFDKVYFAGRIHGQYHYLKKIQQETILFMSLSFVLVLLFLIWVFKKLLVVIIPIVVVVLTLLWVFIGMAVFQHGIDVISVLLPTILFVVGISDSVHFFSRYLDVYRKNKDSLTSIKLTIKDVGKATFLTSLTTAVGFLTLLTVSIRPIKEFGIITAIGVVLAFILTYAIVPPAVYLLNTRLLFKEAKQNNTWNTVLSWLFLYIVRNPKKILWVTLGVILISVYGIFKINVENFLLEDISDKDPLKEGYIYQEKNFSGARPFEMGVEIISDSIQIWDFQTMKSLEKVHEYLIDSFGVHMLISPLSIIQALNQSSHNGNIQYYQLPDSLHDYEKTVKTIQKYQKSLPLKGLISKDKKTMRITGKMPDYGAKSCLQKEKKLQEFIKSLQIEGIEFHYTGMGSLIDKNNLYLVKNMLWGLLISFVIISMIMMMLFKSPNIIIVSLIPNIIPLLMIGAVMGYFNIHLNVASSIIFTIAFSICVDDTIHFLTKYNLELNKSKHPLFALKNTFLHTGKAIIITSLILSGGFLLLIFSSFQSVYNVGLLISITLFFAVLADLFLLPVLLLWGRGKNKKNH